MKWWLGLACALTLIGAAPAGAARIAAVQEKTVAQPAPQVNSLQGRRLPKFVETLETEAVSFAVEWEASEKDAAPLTVQFHYRAEARRDAPIFVMSRTYERIDTQRRVTGFTLPAGQRAAAWRVRVLKGGAVLAERSSSTWE